MDAAPLQTTDLDVASAIDDDRAASRFRVNRGVFVDEAILALERKKTEELQQRTFWRRWSQLMRDANETELTGP